MDKTKRDKLQELLLLALNKDGADMGMIRNHESLDDELVIVSHHGFSKEYLSHFNVVKPFDHSSCGRAFGIGSTILVSDIAHDPSFKKQLKTIKELKVVFSAVKSVPILSKSGRKLGVITCHFKEPHWDWHMDSLHDILPAIGELLIKSR